MVFDAVPAIIMSCPPLSSLYWSHKGCTQNGWQLLICQLWYLTAVYESYRKKVDTKWLSDALPVRGLGVAASKEVPQGAGRGDLGVSGVEDHADVFGNNGRLNAVVELWSGETVSMLALKLQSAEHCKWVDTVTLLYIVLMGLLYIIIHSTFLFTCMQPF